MYLSCSKLKSAPALAGKPLHEGPREGNIPLSREASITMETLLSIPCQGVMNLFHKEMASNHCRLRVREGLLVFVNSYNALVRGSILLCQRLCSTCYLESGYWAALSRLCSNANAWTSLDWRPLSHHHHKQYRVKYTTLCYTVNIFMNIYIFCVMFCQWSY